MTDGSLRFKMAWWVVCLLPQRVAAWWIWSRVPLPASWVPYVFGRSIGRNGLRVTQKTEVARGR